MKTMLRRLLCLTVAVLLCLSMSGCIALDELKVQQAFWNAADDFQLFESFTWNGATYKQLPFTEFEFALRSSEWKEIHVTQSDVPVLLSVFAGQTMSLSDNEVLAEYTDYEQGDESYYYCRADQYDALLAKLESGDIEFNRCFYSWYDWEKEEDDSYELSEAEYAAVQTVYNTVKPEVLPDGAEMYFDYEALLYQLSEDGLFERMWVSACVVGDTYYLRSYDEDYNTVLYTVPKEHTAAFKSLLAAQIVADRADAEYWGEDWDEDWEDDTASI